MFGKGKAEEADAYTRWKSNGFVIIGLIMAFFLVIGWVCISGHAWIDLRGVDLPIWGFLIVIPLILFVILDLVFDKKSRGIRHFCVGGLLLVWNIVVFVKELNEPTKSIFRGSPTVLFVWTLIGSLMIITAGLLRMRDK
ncbi:MAG: hypothetical protein IKS10_03975 [Lachnospiraceae bacterium]|nr:hypothetical protein [Lachnospiraceae bacterium]